MDEELDILAKMFLVRQAAPLNCYVRCICIGKTVGLNEWSVFVGGYGVVFISAVSHTTNGIKMLGIEKHILQTNTIEPCVLCATVCWPNII